MRYWSLLIIPLCLYSFATAQSRLPGLGYTKSGSHYLSSAETDSVIQATVATLFREKGIPPALLEAKFPQLKNLLVSLSRNNIIQSFKRIEGRLKKGPPATKGSALFNENKQLFTLALETEIRNSFRSNKGLSQYLSLSTSDRIIHFNSTVRVLENGKLAVEEIITINNGNGQPDPIYGSDAALGDMGLLNDEIKRGIVRSFPLAYINRYKLFQNTSFELKEVLRNGERENYHTRKQANGIELYTGSSSVYLKPGTYTYTIRYETDRQLKLLKEYDELYWNVTGNGWSFRMDSATCTVILPKGAAPLSSKCYTGKQGDTAEECSFTRFTKGDSTVLVFKTKKALTPYNGLTISSSWPKGFVHADRSVWQQVKYYVWNNKGVFFLPIAAFLSAVFCFIAWLRVGRDPKKGTIYAQYEPPAGYSPAALGYIYFQYFNQQLTAATIVDAAVRKKISIAVEKEGLIFKHNVYTITRGKAAGKTAPGGYEDFATAVDGLVGTTVKRGKYNSALGKLNRTVQEYCESWYKTKSGHRKTGGKGYFRLNGRFTILPILFCIAILIWSFFGGLVPALYNYNFWQLAYFAGGIVLCVVVLKKFARLLSAYSPEGRKLMDKIEGFRLFLSTADEKRFDTMLPPAKSLELYEKYLPFAIALDCEIEWGDQFEEIISAAILSGAVMAGSFSHSMSRDSNSFGSSFGTSFSGAISSASTPPSSSSGGGSSFGGGSSGGGGGGGGGGGW